MRSEKSTAVDVGIMSQHGLLTASKSIPGVSISTKRSSGSAISAVITLDATQTLTLKGVLLV